MVRVLAGSVAASVSRNRNGAGSGGLCGRVGVKKPRWCGSGGLCGRVGVKKPRWCGSGGLCSGVGVKKPRWCGSGGLCSGVGVKKPQWCGFCRALQRRRCQEAAMVRVLPGSAAASVSRSRNGAGSAGLCVTRRPYHGAAISPVARRLRGGGWGSEVQRCPTGRARRRGWSLSSDGPARPHRLGARHTVPDLRLTGPQEPRGRCAHAGDIASTVPGARTVTEVRAAGVVPRTGPVSRGPRRS